MIRTDRLLRHYSPEAEGLRDLLRRYTAMKVQDLFPEGTTKLPNFANRRTVGLLEEHAGQGWWLLMRATLPNAGCSRRDAGA